MAGARLLARCPAETWEGALDAAFRACLRRPTRRWASTWAGPRPRPRLAWGPTVMTAAAPPAMGAAVEMEMEVEVTMEEISARMKLWGS